jgi:hypothetical protein
MAVQHFAYISFARSDLHTRALPWCIAPFAEYYEMTQLVPNPNTAFARPSLPLPVAPERRRWAVGGTHE